MPISLSEVRSPEDIRHLSVAELNALAGEIRAKIISTVSRTGGHLGASLGTVELTLALHSVFDTPRDKIVWDVGHQTYAHKLITGRFERFDTLRQYGGLSGYPKSAESPYDVYDTGHASGAISYALGLARARDMTGDDFNVVAVVGDGVLTSGLAFEGLNNARELNTRIIVVINDNSMSISRSVGGMSRFLTLLRIGKTYRGAKDTLEKLLDSFPNLGPRAKRWVKRLKAGLKSYFFPESWFEVFGFRYYGPIDGHNIADLKRVLEEARRMSEPVIIHTVTEKGRGYLPAQVEPEKFHGPGPFDPETGEILSKGNPTYSKVFGRALCEFAKKNSKIVAITAAMADGTGLSDFRKLFPERFFDVGIAEQHAVTFAAGLAKGGLLPVVAIYSTFLQRAYDQIIEDVCLQKLKVVFAIDRAGIVGEDGETHQGQFDLGYLRSVPGLVVMAPRDERELVNMLYTALTIPGSCAIRYPRGSGPGASIEEALSKPELVQIGKAEVLREGKDANIYALGSMVPAAEDAAERLGKMGISCGVVNARFVKPVDREMVERLLEVGPLLVVEENSPVGGLGEAVLDVVGAAGKHDIGRLTLPDAFIPHGSQAKMRELLGMTADEMVRRILVLLDRGGKTQ